MTLASTGTLTEKSRINTVDLMRGLVMVIMALDHTRDFFHVNANVFDPTDLTKTSAVLFFTRWITHFCAPTFVLLSGVAIRLSTQRKSPKELSRFLLTRGLWLLVIEIVVMRFSFFFNFYYDFTFFQVIFAIGASMIAMSALIFLPRIVTAVLGIVLLFTHNAFDGIPPVTPGDGVGLYTIWTLLNQAGPLQLSPNHVLLVAYPVIPWLSIMLCGFALGRWYLSDYDKEQRKWYLLIAGLLAILIFIVLRGFNLYGDPSHWTTQKDFLFTMMSFLNCTKYPASLLYTLMTIGPVLIILSLLEKVNLRVLRPIHIFGRVPMFYYILHFYLLHTISLIAFMVSTGTAFSEIDFHFSKSFGGIPFGFGYPLIVVYAVWMGLVIFIYPLCNWYNEYKSTRGYWWLSYL